MATFALVHGVCAGSWSWDLVKPHLEAAGHDVIAVDLPGDDPNARFSDFTPWPLHAPQEQHCGVP